MAQPGTAGGGVVAVLACASGDLAIRASVQTFESAVPALAAWQHHYNYERFSLALQGQTPAEKLALRLPIAQLA